MKKLKAKSPARGEARQRRQSVKSRLIFLAIFTVLGLVALQVPINVLAGSNVKFTLFDLLAPTAGAFLGLGWGVLAVLLMQFVGLTLNGFSGVDSGSFLRLLATLRILPMILATSYFALSRLTPDDKPAKGKFSRLILLVPVLAMIVFNLHPVGRSVWFYSLFWLIPILLWGFSRRFLLMAGLGSTFSAHAVGGALWIWAFNLPAAVWISLIPVVILERSIFALGISAAYILINNVLAYLSGWKLIPRSIEIDRRYLLKF